MCLARTAAKARVCWTATRGRARTRTIVDSCFGGGQMAQAVEKKGEEVGSSRYIRVGWGVRGCGRISEIASLTHLSAAENVVTLNSNSHHTLSSTHLARSEQRGRHRRGLVTASLFEIDAWPRSFPRSRLSHRSSTRLRGYRCPRAATANERRPRLVGLTQPESPRPVGDAKPTTNHQCGVLSALSALSASCSPLSDVYPSAPSVQATALLLTLRRVTAPPPVPPRHRSARSSPRTLHCGALIPKLISLPLDFGERSKLMR